MNFNVQGLIKGISKGISSHSTEVLTGFGLILGGTALWSVGKASPKAHSLIKKEEKKLERPLTFFEKFKLTKRVWIAPGLYSAAAATCFVGSCAIGVKQTRALTAALSMSEAASVAYQSKVKEIVGEKKEQKIRDEIARDTVKQKPPTEVVYISGDGPELFKETLTNEYFRSDTETVRRAMNNFNAELYNGTMSMSKNNWLQGYLNISPTSDGELLGWNTDKRMSFHIVHEVGPDEKEVVHLIVHDQLPFSKYDNLH